MPYLLWRAVRVVIWMALCAVGGLYLWERAQVPLNPVADRLMLSPKSGRFGAVNLCVCMWPDSNGTGSPGSGVLLIGHGGGNWVASLPELKLVEPEPAGNRPAGGPPGYISQAPLTEAELARALIGSEWPSADPELTADIDELWDLVRSAPIGGLSTRVRRFSILQASPWRRPVWAHPGIGPLWLLLIWASGAVLLWRFGSEPPGDRALAEAVWLERSRRKIMAADPRDAGELSRMSQRFQSAAPLKPSPMAGPIQTSGPTLDYRTPVPGGDAVGRVLHELARAESLDLAGAAGKLGVGLPLCLLGPLFATAMVEAVAARWGPDLLPSFATVFLLATVVLVPLLLWLERRTGGNFFLDAVRGEPSPLSASSYGEFEMRRTGFLWTCYAEIALAGPRLVWEFIDWLRGRPEGDTSTRLVATQVANELFVAGEGLGMADLVRPDRPAAQVARAVKLLLVEEWVGLSSRRDRVWLSSRTAIRLAEVLAQPPHTHLPAVTHAPARPGDGMRLTRG